MFSRRSEVNAAVSATRVLWGQIIVVFTIVLVAVWGATQWTAWRLGFQAQLGSPWFEVAGLPLGSGLFDEFKNSFSATPTITDALALVLGALSLMGLSIFGPAIATGLVSGAPQLGAGAAVGTGLGVAGLGAAGYMGAKAGLGAAASAAGGAVRGGAALAGGARTAYGLGDASVGSTGTGGAAAGFAAVAQAGAGLAVNKGKEVASRASQSLRSSYRSGQAGAWKATGGKNEVNPAHADTACGSATASGAASSSSAPPAWANRMKPGQAVSHGMTAAAHAIRSGDHGGGSMSVSLDQDDRR